MKLFNLIILLGLSLSSLAWAQDMSSAENQCRLQAKEIALKTYQSCITEARTTRIEEIRQEYQDKIEQLKKKYEAQIQDLQNTQEVSQDKDSKSSSEAVPTVLEPQDSKPSTQINEPQVILKPAPSTKSKATKKSTKVTTYKRIRKKPTKRIARSLPDKKIVTETKLASPDVVKENPMTQENEITNESETLSHVESSF